MYIESQKEFISKNDIANVVYRDNWKHYELTVNRKDSDNSEKFSIEKLLQANTIEYISKENEMDQLIFDYTDTKYTMAFDYRLRSICYFMLKMASSNYHLQFKKGGYILSKETEYDLIDDTKETKEELMYNYLK